MAPLNRYQLMRAHMWLAAFFLPVTLLFLISGLLYTLNVEGRTSKQSEVIELSSAYSADLVRLKSLVLAELGARSIDVPHGEPELKSKKGNQYLYWSDLDQSVTLRPGDTPTQVELVLRERNWLAQLMRIHRGEAGEALRWLTVGLPIALLLIYLSGIFLALGAPALRRGVLIALGSGAGLLLVLFVTA